MIAAIIQARMTSTRLPGKVMLKVNNRPLLDYMVERAEFIKEVDQIIIATTTNTEDDAIVEYAEKKGLLYYRGSENDVLERYYESAKIFKVKHILRITSDCPLIDPELCDTVVNVYLNKKADYVHLAPSYAEGLDCEIFSFRVLELAHKNAIMKSEREHVTPYLHKHPELVEKFIIENKTDDSKYRFTVDEPEDYEVVKAIIKSLYRKDAIFFGAEEIKNFLDDNPDIFKLNAHIIRNEGFLKSLNEDEVLK